MKKRKNVLVIVDELETSFFQFGDWLNSAMVIVAMILSYRADRVLHALYEDACEVGRLTDTSARLVEAATICGAVIGVEPETQAGIRIKRAIDDTADRIAEAIQYRDLNAVDASLRRVPRLSIWEERVLDCLQGYQGRDQGITDSVSPKLQQAKEPEPEVGI